MSMAGQFQLTGVCFQCQGPCHVRASDVDGRTVSANRCLLSVSRSMSCEGLRCRWQDSFSVLAVDIASCVKVHIKGVTESFMTREENKLHEHGAIDIMPVPEELRGGRLDYPRTISKVGLKGSWN